MLAVTSLWLKLLADRGDYERFDNQSSLLGCIGHIINLATKVGLKSLEPPTGGPSLMKVMPTLVNTIWISNR